MDISAHTECLVLAFRHFDFDDIRKRFEVFDGFHQDHIHELDVQVLSFLVPLQHVQYKTVRYRVVVNAATIVHEINRRSLDGCGITFGSMHVQSLRRSLKSTCSA